jgi:predicted transcriptional regulator
MARKNKPRKTPGRPCNEIAFKKMVQLLKTKKGATIPQLTEKLNLPKRTVYHYLKKAEEQGHRVVKLGSENSAPFSII